MLLGHLRRLSVVCTFRESAQQFCHLHGSEIFHLLASEGELDSLGDDLSAPLSCIALGAWAWSRGALRALSKGSNGETAACAPKVRQHPRIPLVNEKINQQKARKMYSSNCGLDQSTLQARTKVFVDAKHFWFINRIVSQIVRQRVTPLLLGLVFLRGALVDPAVPAEVEAAEVR